ncbi:hypothetical protein [Azospirillum sp. sgz302134]
MRYSIIAAASAMALLAACSSESSGPSGYGMSGSSSVPSATTSGSTTTPGGTMLREGGMQNRTISPDESGMGQSPTRESLTNPNRAGSGASGASPYSSGTSKTQPYPMTNQQSRDYKTMSPDDSGMGEPMTRRSLPNTAGTQ